MRQDNSELVLFAFILAAFAALLGYFFGLESGIKWTQDQAVQAKVGHWNVDPTTGKTDFVFTPATSGQ